MNKPILNLDEVELQPRPDAFAATGDAAQRFDARMGMIGARLGAKELGYNLTAVPPGKRAFPHHNHRFNEEMFFVVAGRGEVRVGEETFPIRPGDVIACPPGGPESAHQIVNTGECELRYLAVSTKHSPEICDYPDSGKFGIFADFGKDADGNPQLFRHVGCVEDSRDYWEGE